MIYTYRKDNMKYYEIPVTETADEIGVTIPVTRAKINPPKGMKQLIKEYGVTNE